jgi:hypothetical protein
VNTAENKRGQSSFQVDTPGQGPHPCDRLYCPNTVTTTVQPHVFFSHCGLSSTFPPLILGGPEKTVGVTPCDCAMLCRSPGPLERPRVIGSAEVPADTNLDYQMQNQGCFRDATSPSHHLTRTAQRSPGSTAQR